MSVLAALRAAIAAGTPCILVTIARAHGSTPREAGASMLVASDGTIGTIGGGALEMEAILKARRMLADGTPRSALDVALGPAIGQCCGGRVELVLEVGGAVALARMERESDAEHARRPAVFVFGAGHTGQALARALAPLPFRLTVVDTRFDRLTELDPLVERVGTPLPEIVIDGAQAGAAFVVMTHDHALDFLLAARALERGDAAYVGMIGSATKRAKFRRHLVATGSRADPRGLVLPIGGSALRDKRPEVIAAMTAAELLSTLKPLEKPCTGFAQARGQCSMNAADAKAQPNTDAERHAATS